MKRRVFICILGIFFAFSTSCKMEVIEKPTPKHDIILNPSDYPDEISAPEGLTATQGGLKKVNLSWKTLNNAIQYLVYSSTTPFDTFTQIAETSDNSTSIQITEKSGVIKYYKIAAVNYYGTVSDYSDVIMGSTLATPVITSINSTENGTVATVNWWMDNCSKITYEDSIQYIITCYEEDESTVVESKTAEGNTTSISFEKLEPNTNYFFEVEACLSSAQEDVEKSGKLDAATARRLIPKAVKELTVTQGISTEAVEISFQTPEYVDYSLGRNSYEEHPVYFTIERKLMGEEDSAYTKIVSYLGSITEDDDSETDTNIFFSSKTGTATSANVTVNAAGAEEPNEIYSDYAPGTTITYKDSNILRGEQYTYRISSYVDDTVKTISSDEAVAEADGWLIAIPEFTLKAVYKQEGKTFTSVTVTFNLKFEDFGKDDYSYVIVENYRSFDGNKTKEKVLSPVGTSPSDIKGFQKVFDFSEKISEGYYNYDFYIAEADTTTKPSAPYETVKSPKRLSVTKDATKLPVVNDFKIVDGSSKNITLSWDYNKKYTYSLNWVDYDADGIEIADSDKSVAIKTGDNGNATITDNVITYVDTAITSTTRRFYTLTAENGGIYNYYSGDSISEVLGKAVPVMGEPDYSTIKIFWPKVQKADKYEISAYYKSDTEHKTALIKSSDYVYDQGLYSCVISNPVGYNDAKTGGSPIEFTVKSINSKTKSSTKGKTEVFTLGPAGAKATFSKTKASKDHIDIKWKKLPGVKGYLIYRPCYNDGNAAVFEKADMYYYNVSENKLYIEGEEINKATVDNSSDDYFILTDTQAAATANSSYENNQDKIAWGLPFGYVILPVKNSGDFIFETGSLKLEGTSKVKFENIKQVECLAATTGYGLNLYADKAETDGVINLSWTQPYIKGQTCKVYRRHFGSNDSWSEETATSLPKNTTTYTDELTGDEKYLAWEYAVMYEATSTTPAFANSFLNYVTTDERYTKPSTDEPRNKGYTLNVKFTPAPSSDKQYAEVVEWNTWDVSERKLVPTTMTLMIDNTNLDTGWSTLATIDTQIIRYAPTGVTTTSTKNSVTVTPKFDEDNISTGYLLVLHDSKHYYRLDVKREGSKNGTAQPFEIKQGENHSVYTYREITGKEFVKLGMLIYTDALYSACGGNDWGKSPANGYSYDNTVWTKHDGGNLRYKIFNYPNDGRYPINVSIKDSIQGTVYAKSWIIDVQNYTREIHESTFVYSLDGKSSIPSSIKSSYVGEITLVSTGIKNVTISCSKLNESINTSDTTSRRKWLPVRMNSDATIENAETSWWHNNAAGKPYGWWYKE